TGTSLSGYPQDVMVKAQTGICWISHQDFNRGAAMKRIVVFAIAATMAATISPIGALAQSAKEFTGTWTFVSAMADRDGQQSGLFGPNAKGALMFDAKGRYAIVFIGANLPKFASNNRATGTADENKAVITGSLSHFGSYEVSEAGKSFTFRIEKA